jgi:hypothetical protein
MNLLRPAALAAFLLLAACSSKPTYLERDVVRVVVLPPVTAAVNPDAWKAYWPLLVDWVAHRGYRVIKPEAVERYFQGKFRTVDPDVMRQMPPGEIARAFAADGVFYAQITRASSSYLVVSADARMEVDFELVEGKSEEIVWSHHAVAALQRRMEGKGQDAIFSALAVAATPMDADPAEFWKQCVADAGQRMPLAGRNPDPEAAAPAPEGSLVKKKAGSAPPPSAPAPAPGPELREIVSGPPFVVDSEGWTLAVGPRFLLISNVPGKTEEIPGGFVHLGTKLANNEGLFTYGRAGGGTFSMKMNELPADWHDDLVTEYRRSLRKRPDLTIKEWLKARLLRFPSRHVQALID